MPKERPNQSDPESPVQAIRQPLCYGCRNPIGHPGYCPYCVQQQERDLKAFAMSHDLPRNPVNGDTGMYNGMQRVWVNGYWINPLCAPDWIKARIQARLTRAELTPEKRAELAQEHAHIRATVPGMVGVETTDNDVPF